MRTPRIFRQAELAPGMAHIVDGQAAQHLLKVLRCSTGDPVILFNGDGTDYSGRIDATQRNSLTVREFERQQQDLAVASGYWPLLRYSPALRDAGKKPFVLDSPRPSIPLEEYIYNENRYRILKRTNPEEAAALLKSAQELVEMRWQTYVHMSKQEPAKFQPAAAEI